ncbi:error-prone DNA polymerase [Shimia ponticola]|uniref:error-prone DNA polymerase n=1 Tax=Shimia ponticola TaxID=2582893 RepID=UPI0011BD6D57|nr:error-prone DNA polymerase [Shimia ponticola]
MDTISPFTELSATSNFTFLTGGSHPEEYMRRAAILGMSALAIADENSVAGIVRAHTEAREIARRVKIRRDWDAEHGLIGPPCPDAIPAPPSADIYATPRLIPAARIVLSCGFTVTALPRHRKGWGNLCRLISEGRLAADKGTCHLDLKDLEEFRGGLTLLIHPPEALRDERGAGGWRQTVERLTRRSAEDTYLIMAPRYDGVDPARLRRLYELAHDLGLPPVASGLPMMHHGARRRLTDVLSAVRLSCRVDELGAEAQANGEQRLRSAVEMAQLFHRFPEAVANTQTVEAALQFSLDELRYEYPSEAVGSETPGERLRRLAYEGMHWRYPNGATDKVKRLLEHELTLIGKLKYEPYFLTVRDVVAYARAQGILCQGRGSAANSVVCYCLGVTSVSPELGTMVFERFVSEARNEPPDIDVDFEHERREEVIQHIYERYGRHRAGLCATVIHYRGKRAVREVGRAMGLSDDTISAMSSQLWGFFSANGLEDHRMREIGLDPTDRRLVQALELIYEIIGFPRHLSQHVGGFIITEGRLDELVPIENATMEDRTVICWDKDDIDSLGILKVDVLALGMLSCIRKAFNLIDEHHGERLTLATISEDDTATYDMLCKADSLGVFQVESRAQMNFLPRMKPRQFYDLVIQVAIIRPGPIQGDMVHPFIRRRNGEEEVSFPSDALGDVLGKTLGVPLFQEQAMQIAIVGAGFTPDESDRLRRSLATFKKHGNVSEFRDRFMKGMAANGYDEAFSERCFSQIEGFGSYGFPESHAASFALLVYVSAWMKCHHPGIFACALLNAQPMGFYAPAQIVRDAREHGVTVLPICINNSAWDNLMERQADGTLALRLGFRQLKSMTESDADRIELCRGNGYSDIHDVWRKAAIPAASIQLLAEADAFASLGLSRRAAIWEAKALVGTSPMPLFSGDLEDEIVGEPQVHLPKMTEGEEVVEDYVAMRMTLRKHPVELLRHRLTKGLGKRPELTLVGSHRDARAALQPGRTDMWDRRNGHGPGYEGPQTQPLRKIAENRVGMVHPRDQGLRIANR